MQNDNKIAGKIKTQITRFANKISHGFQKPTKKFFGSDALWDSGKQGCEAVQHLQELKRADPFD